MITAPPHGTATPVFDAIDRAPDDVGELHAESDFSYLNRSGRVPMTRTRDLVEEWFSRYPEAHSSRLRSRLRGDDTDFHSAFFELYLHELLLVLGYVPAVEQPAGTKGKSPDFLVSRPDGSYFYLEACVVSGKSKDDAAAEQRASQVYDQIDKLTSPDFFIGVEVHEHPSSPPPGQRIKRFLEEEIARASWDEVSETMDRRGLDGLPRWRFSHDSWEVDFFPIPKKPDERGTSEPRPLGLWFHDAKTLSNVDDVRAAIVRKAGKYGDLGRPFVVAVNSLSGITEENLIFKSLLGRTQFIVTTSVAGVEASEGRLPDGVWTSLGGPRYTRLSGVLVAHRAKAWSVASSKLWYCPNPWAATALPAPFPSLTRFDMVDDHLQRVEGATVAELFGLDPQWPGE